MRDSETPERASLREQWLTDFLVGGWLLALIFGGQHFLEVTIRRARGDEDANLSNSGMALFALATSALALRLSSRFRREDMLGENALRLGGTVTELERVVRLGAEESTARDARAAVREQLMESIARSTYRVAVIGLLVAVLSFVFALAK